MVTINYCLSSALGEFVSERNRVYGLRMRICAPLTVAPWQTFQDLRSSLSVSQPLRSVGTPPPFFELRRGFSCVSAARHGCSCAGASPGDAVLFPSAVHLQPSMCTCSLGRRSRTISSKGNNTTTQNKRKRNLTELNGTTRS